MLPGFFSKNKSSERKYETYEDITAYLTDDDVANLKLNIYPIEQLDNIAHMIKQGCYEQIATTKNFPIHALLALKHAKINGMEFSTSQIFYNIYTHPHNRKYVKIISIFKNGQITQQANVMINATMKLTSASHLAFLKRDPVKNAGKIAKLNNQLDKLDWTSEERNKFFAILKNLPISEHFFLLIPDHDLYCKKTLTIRINFEMNFNVFSRLIVGGKPMIMIPSKGMMQAYLEATRGKQAPRLISRFGLSPWKGLWEGMQAKEKSRDFFVSFQPLAYLNPGLVDNHLAPLHSAEIEKHDGLYHGIRFADVPAKITDLCAALAKVLWPSLSDAISQITYVEKLKRLYAQRCIDMDYLEFDRHKQDDKSHEDLFWINIKNLIVYVAIQQCGEYYKEGEEFLESEYIKDFDLLYKALGDAFIENEKEWQLKYNFSIASLASHIQKYNSKILRNILEHINDKAKEGLDSLEALQRRI